MGKIFVESKTTDASVKVIRGVQYIVCSFFDGEERLHELIGNLIQESFESSTVLGITEESLSD